MKEAKHTSEFFSLLTISNFRKIIISNHLQWKRKTDWVFYWTITNTKKITKQKQINNHAVTTIKWKINIRNTDSGIFLFQFCVPVTLSLSVSIFFLNNTLCYLSQRQRQYQHQQKKSRSILLLFNSRSCMCVLIHITHVRDCRTD